MNSEKQERLAAVRVAVRCIQDVERQLDEFLVQARDAGATWEELGAALGLTRQAATLRYEKAVRRSPDAAQQDPRPERKER